MNAASAPPASTSHSAASHGAAAHGRPALGHTATAASRFGPATMTEALALAEAAGTVREAAAALRQRFAPMPVLVMDAMDLRRETPLAEGPRRSLYGGSSDGHCWQMTADPGAAAALFVCERGRPWTAG